MKRMMVGGHGAYEKYLDAYASAFAGGDFRPDLDITSARPKVSENAFQMDTARTVERGGKTYQQDTANIGKSPRPAKPAPVEAIDPMLEDLPEEEGDVIEATERPPREGGNRCGLSPGLSHFSAASSEATISSGP